MGLHYRIENNDLSACLECGKVIDGGEKGCVAAATAFFEMKLSSKDLKNRQKMTEAAYRLQHYQYYEIEQQEALEILITLIQHVIQQKQLKQEVLTTCVLKLAEEIFFYFRPVTSVMFVADFALIEKTDIGVAMEQYIQDVVLGYYEYKSDIESLLEMEGCK